MPTLVSVFDRPQDVVAAVKKLKGRGFDGVETYSPAPFEEIDDAGHERRLRPNDGEVDPFSASELQEPLDVLAANIDALGRLGDSRITRSAVDFRT